MKPEDRDRLIALAVVLVALVALGIGVFASSRVPPPVIQGFIDATQIDVGSKVAGRVAAVDVKIGDRVHAGQTLFRIDSPESRAALESARGAQLTAAGAQHAAQGAQKAANGAQMTATSAEERVAAGSRREDIAAARAQWLSAQAQARLAATTLHRTQALYEQAVATQQERDTAAAAAQSTAQQERSAYEIYQRLLAGNRPEDVTAASGQVVAAGGLQAFAAAQAIVAAGQAQQAQGAVALANSQTDDTRIDAPASGEVTDVQTHPGELAPRGYPVVSILEVDQPWVAFSVPENRLDGFREGTIVNGRVPALNGAVVRFKIYYVAALGSFATEQSTRTTTGADLRTFDVRAHPLERASDLRAGMSVIYQP
jgi:HlyD family secretion protein